MELSGSLIKVYHVLFLIINKIMHVIFSMCFKKLFIKSHFSFDNFKSFFSNFKILFFLISGEFTNIYKSMYFFKVEWEINGV